jgi:hypothetical protein
MGIHSILMCLCTTIGIRTQFDTNGALNKLRCREHSFDKVQQAMDGEDSAWAREVCHHVLKIAGSLALFCTSCQVLFLRN